MVSLLCVSAQQQRVFLQAAWGRSKAYYPSCRVPHEPAPQWVSQCTCICLTCNTAGARTSGTSLVGRGCWRIDVMLQMGEGGKGHMRNSACHSDTTQAVCSVFCADGTSTNNEGTDIMLECMHVGACIPVHACGYTCASPATPFASSSQRMHLPIPHLSDISAAMQQFPIYSRCMHSARQACNKIVPCGWWDAACTHTQVVMRHMGIHVDADGSTINVMHVAHLATQGA